MPCLLCSLSVMTTVLSSGTLSLQLQPSPQIPALDEKWNEDSVI
jgi:hypothetical protein